MKKVLIILTIFYAFSCVEKRETTLESTSDEVVNSKYKPIDVINVIEASGYNYVQALEKGDTVWFAMGKYKVNENQTYYYTDVMVMNNFTSKELDRTFETIYFLDKLLENPREPLPGEEHTQTTATAPIVDELPSVEGVVTIKEVFENRAKYANKSITVQGRVTKINLDIMDRNWVHIQDGTKSGDDFDLTITTKDAPEVGEIVKFTGTLAVDKDFTMGYKYKLILENASLPNTQM
jgi:hypothetical protein